MSLRLTNWFWVVLLLGASATLYHTSYRVQDMAQHLSTLDAAQIAEQESIHVLEAEWSYLTSPARLQKLTAKYLPLRTAAIAQIASVATLEQKIPLRPSAPDMTFEDVAASAHTPVMTESPLTHTASINVEGR